MIYLSCDYHYGAHPKVLEALTKYNTEPNSGYGEDPHCANAARIIRRACAGQTVDKADHQEVQADDKALKALMDVHFLVGGTQTNTTIIAAALRPYQGVITAETGHINVHETGAIESAGHKVIALPGVDGKLSATQIEACVKAHESSSSHEHMVMPKMVYISNPTEIGSIYSKEELEAISSVCHAHGLYLFMDGARLGYGLTSDANDLTLEDITKACDVFYIGGTKCGAMFGEAVVITHPELKENFRYMIKQRGGMLAKGWLLGVQYEALMADNLYFDICRQANEQAARIKAALLEKGFKFTVDSPTNQLFVMLPKALLGVLSEKYILNDDNPTSLEPYREVRICTSWASTDEEVDALIEDIKAWESE